MGKLYQFSRDLTSNMSRSKSKVSNFIISTQYGTDHMSMRFNLETVEWKADVFKNFVCMFASLAAGEQY